MNGALKQIGGTRSYELVKSHLLIGRDSRCDIVLKEQHVSANHCELFMEEGRWLVRDLHSSNGTKVNGVRVADTEELLEPGDTLSIGHISFELQYAPQ